jgi:hypothetical protein
LSLLVLLLSGIRTTSTHRAFLVLPRLSTSFGFPSSERSSLSRLDIALLLPVFLQMIGMKFLDDVKEVKEPNKDEMKECKNEE